jgi:hypothetical protein
VTTIAISGPDAARLLPALDEPVERGWVLTARQAADGALLLGRVLHDVPTQAYLERGPRRLEISSVGFVPAFGSARRDGDLPVFVHSHPGGSPRPSVHDDGVDERLAAFAAQRGMAGYAALVLGGSPAAPRFTGRLIEADGAIHPIDRLRIAGRDLRLMLAEDRSGGQTAPIFDRQVRAFGHEGQRLLAALRVGVVGAGGTGSATIEQLARLGVGEVIALDDDAIDQSNLTRIHGATEQDIGTYKAALAKMRAESFGTGTHVRAIIGSAASRAGVEALRTCDVVFGCTDDHAGRLVLSRLAYHYLTPVIDCGVVVDTAQDHVRGVVGRVTVMAPAEPCLVCRGQVDPRLAAEEMMDPERRLALAGEGYAEGAQGPAPAVVAFTTAISALAVNELLGRLLGYAESTSTQLLLRLHAQAIARGGRRAAGGHHCVTPAAWGLGDTEPVLGMAGLT